MPAQASLRTNRDTHDLRPNVSGLDQKHVTDLQGLRPHHPTLECHQAFPRESLPVNSFKSLIGRIDKTLR